MPNFAHDISFTKDLDPSGRLTAFLERLMQSHNHVANQVNASPVGTTPAPSAPSSVNVKTYSPGVHQVDVQDNNPVNRGIIYHYEYADNKDFRNPILCASTPSKSIIAPVGSGPTFWRVVSQYMASPPSEPAYLGTAAIPGSVDAGGNTRIAVAGMGSGTEPNLQPQGGAGFGFNETRDLVPRLPE